MPVVAAGSQLLGRVATVVPLVAVVAAVMAPRGTAATFFALASVPVLALVLLESLRGLRARPFPPLALTLVALGAYLAVNALWSADRGEAFGKVIFYWAIIAAAMMAYWGIARLDDRTLERIDRGILIGLLIGSLFLLIEVLTNQWLKRTLFSLVPVFRPDPKHAVVRDGVVTGIGAYVMNRSFAVVSLALWPVLLMMRAHLDTGVARVSALALIVMAAVGVFLSAHETSMLAFVFSGLAFSGMVLMPRLMRSLIMVGWVAAVMLVVPIAIASYSAGLHQAKWIPETGRNRIILWNVTASKALEAPLFGTGVASTKSLDEQAIPQSQTRPGHTYPQRTGRHAHNIFLQTWYELGGVGASLLLAAGLMALMTFARLPAGVQPYAYAGFVAAVMIGAFSWGMWQTWFMAAFGIWALALLLAIEAGRRRPAFTPQ